jgi:ABC-2 type transport system permease protein
MGFVSIRSIVLLGLKELRGLWRDPMMLFLIVYVFTMAIYIAGTAVPDLPNKAPIAIVDEDRSTLSARIADAFLPPYFVPPGETTQAEADAGLESGDFTFALGIPPHFERDVLAGERPQVQLRVDATRMSQAFSGAGFVEGIVQDEVREFVAGVRDEPEAPVAHALRMRFNPNLEQSWFGSILELVNAVTMLSIVLAGAALIREREHGTVEHLLTMPVRPVEIMLAKIWAMALVVVAGTAFSLAVVVERALGVAVQGSTPLWLATVALHLAATTSVGIFLATVARSMPRFGLLLVLVLIPLEMLSGGQTPRESMPELVRTAMLASPTTHFVAASQAVLFRGAGLDIVWPQLAAIVGIGAVFFTIALARFRRSLGEG